MDFNTKRSRLLVAAVASSAVLLVACGDGGGGGGQAARSPAPGGADTTGAPAETIELVAEDNRFDKTELTAPADANVVVQLQNRGQMPHNFSLYENEQAQQAIFQGEIFSGPDASKDYEFTTPEPGSYFFRCDVHPVEMKGTFRTQ